MSLQSYPEEHYSPERIQEAYLIVHPDILDRYEITLDEFHAVFIGGSNFSNLKYPIVDDHDIVYHDSEGHYMAQRFDDIDIKRKISIVSGTKGQSKKEAYKYKEFMNIDDNDRIVFMQKAIKAKFDGSKWRRQLLLETGNREIIEFTYWNDQFFGISHDIRIGRNILGKILMEYRSNVLAQLG